MPPLVLLVDDEADNQRMMRYFLESWGYQVELAGNGEEALEKAAHLRPALVLLDLEMPVMDGFEACQLLKQGPGTADIPVILFTNHESTSDKVDGIRRGADDYVVKTVEPEEIQVRIELALRRLRGRGRSSLSADTVIRGSLEEKPFPEALQLALAYGQGGVLVVRKGELEGRVFLLDGEMLHAELGALEGVDALFELSIWSQGSFSYVVRESSPPRTLHQSTTSLLVETTRRMDEWRLISSRIESFDVVPHRVAGAGLQESLRLTREDWRVMRLVDGVRSLRAIADAAGTDPFEVGRVVFGLLAVGALGFEPDSAERDSLFDVVPELETHPRAPEPFELSATEWRLLARVDGKRDLGMLAQLVGLTPRKVVESFEQLLEKGFLRVRKSPAPRTREREEKATSARDLRAVHDE